MVYLIATVILLGILIFVHEFGHFLIARYFGVRVEVFSLGFGPKVLKKKIGHTEYCLSAIPLGGYVKMFGDELDKEVPRDQQRYGYLSQPIPKKSAIAFAGPAFNLGFTVLVFSVLVWMGRDRLAPQVGSIFPGTPAYESGLRTGDTLLTVDGKAVSFGDDAQRILESLTSPTAPLFLSRKSDSVQDQRFMFSVPLVQRFGHNEFGQVKSVAAIDGFDFMIHVPQVEVIGQTSWAQRMGLQDKDLLLRIADHPLTSLEQILPALQAASRSPTSFTLQIARATQPDISCLPDSDSNICPTLALTLTPPTAFPTTLRQLGLAPTELSIGKVKPYSAAEKSNLRSQDVLLEAGGQSLNYFEQFRQLIQSYGKNQKPLPVVIDRSGELISLSVTPEPLTEQEDQPWVAQNYPYAIGIYPFVSITAQYRLYREANPVVALGVGIAQTWEWSIRFTVGIWKLVTGQISAKMLSGPIYIGKMAGDMIQAGAEQFLFLMAIISLNLGLINLLPIPVLDGGHLLFFAIEAVLRRKPSIKVMERAFQIGLAFIILLSLFAIYNDLLRVLN